MCVKNKWYFLLVTGGTKLNAHSYQFFVVLRRHLGFGRNLGLLPGFVLRCREYYFFNLSSVYDCYAGGLVVGLGVQ